MEEKCSLNRWVGTKRDRRRKKLIERKNKKQNEKLTVNRQNKRKTKGLEAC